MLIGSTTDLGKQTLVVGLSQENMDRLREGKPIQICRDTHGKGIPENLHLVLLAGRTNTDIIKRLESMGTVIVRGGAMNPEDN